MGKLRNNALARRGVGLGRIKLAHKTGSAYGVVFSLIEESAINVGAGTIDRIWRKAAYAYVGCERAGSPLTDL